MSNKSCCVRDTLAKAGIELQPLSAINDVLDRLARDELASRVVLEFPDR